MQTHAFKAYDQNGVNIMPRQNSKSSKTARVLNLLTDPDSISSKEEEKEAERTVGDKRTQENIRGALEMEFADQGGGGRESAPTWEIVSSRPDPADKEPETETLYPTLTTMDAPSQSAEERLRSVGDKAPDEYICFNVTQALVEDKVDKYIRILGLCTCARCRIDVIALTMSSLPAKYVVAKPHELIPRLSMYEHKYEAAIVTQVMSACRKVLERPHHERKVKT